MSFLNELNNYMFIYNSKVIRIRAIYVHILFFCKKKINIYY